MSLWLRFLVKTVRSAAGASQLQWKRKPCGDRVDRLDLIAYHRKLDDVEDPRHHSRLACIRILLNSAALSMASNGYLSRSGYIGVFVI